MRLLKYLFLLSLLVLALPEAALSQEVARGYYQINDCGTLYGPSPFRVVCLQLEDGGGRTKGNEYQWTGSAWVQYNGGSGSSIASAITFTPFGNLSSTNVQAALQELDNEKLSASAITGHTILDEAGALTQRASLNFTGAGVVCTDNSGASRTDCTIAGGSVDQAGTYTWTGTHSWRSNNWSLLDSSDTSKILKWNISGITTATTRTLSVPNANTRLLGDSDFSTTGLMARTAANTYAGRSITSPSGNISVTNGNAVAGDVVLDLGATAVQTDQGNTYTTGDQDLGAAASFTLPKATGAAPTLDGRCAQDTTAHRLKCGFNGTTVTLAITSEIQPLNTNLSALSTLTGANNQVALFTGPGAMVLATFGSCIDSAGQHINFDAVTHTFSCGTSSGSGLSGMTSGKYVIATGAATADTSGSLSESGGIVLIPNGFTAGSATNYITPDLSAVTGAKTWTVMNLSGTVRLSTGAFTNGNIVKTDASGFFVDGGAAGTGTWTDSSTNTATNKTIDCEATGNVCTTVSYASMEAAGCNGATASPGFDLPTSGVPTATCFGTTTTQGTLTFADAATQTATRHFRLPTDWVGNVDVDLLWYANAASANAVRWSVASGCVADSEAVSTGPSYNTASASNTAYTGTANQRKTTSFTSIAMTNCSAGETMYLQVQRIGGDGGDTLTASAELLEVGLRIRRAQ